MTRVAVVTGGTRGIGAAISLELQRTGHKVIATYAGNDAVASEFSQKNTILVMKWDVADFQACEDNLKIITDAHGPVDVLVNNAGITRDGFMHKLTPQMWNDVIMTNLSSCFNMSHGVIGPMRDRKFGRIINIASINGQKGQVGQVNYSAAKAGVIGFTHALALEGAAKGITVNAIAPGYIDTDMVRAVPQSVLDMIISQIPQKRLGTSEEIAYIAGFLADDRAGFINGAVISANGGQYMG